MRTSRRPAAAAAFALGLAALAVAASGCSVASPSVITSPYAAADGSNAEITTPGGIVKLRNFLAVSEGSGDPGVVIGAVATEGTQPVRVQLTVLGNDGGTALGEATVTARPGQLASVGAGEGATPLRIRNVPVRPGAVLTLRASTDAGNQDLSLPVLPPVNEYRSLLPTAQSSSPSPSGSPSRTGSASASPSPTS